MTLNARFFRLLTENELFSGVSPELLRAVLTESQVRFIRFAREETIVCALDGRPALGFLLRGELLQQSENGAVPLQTLQTGDVVTAEPGIYLPGRFGVRIEDMVLITEDGYQNFTKADKQLRVLPLE